MLDVWWRLQEKRVKMMLTGHLGFPKGEIVQYVDLRMIIRLVMNVTYLIL